MRYSSVAPFDPHSQVWADLFLDSASAPYEQRLIPGCWPGPRLVGIELNPGPRGGRRGKRALLVAAASRPTVLVSVGKNKKTKSRTKVRSSSQPGLAAEYVKTLDDPWEYGPLALGYDCFVPTVLGTAYLRGSLLVNATDGSFALAMQPTANAMLTYYNGGAANGFSGVLDATNRSALDAQMTSSRVVSGGLRIFALFPSTSSPGALFSGVLPGVAQSSYVTATPTSFSGLSDAELGVGTRGCRVVIRPQDPTSYSFSANPIAGYSSGVAPSSSSVFVAGIGFPIGTRVWYEAVLNLEGLPEVTSLSVGTDASDAPTLASTFPSVEGLWSYVRAKIGPAAIMDAVEGLASMAGQNMLAGGIRAIRSQFGNGSHYRRALVSGANESRRSQSSTVMIEEMKEDSMPQSSRASRRFF